MLSKMRAEISLQNAEKDEIIGGQILASVETMHP
jgi:hypothetical protein